MKKSIMFLLLCMMFIPLVVNGKEDTCEKVSTTNEKTVEIKIKQDILGIDDSADTELSKLNFKYRIMDLDDNVLDETTLDKDMNITFNCFTVSSSDVQNYRLYKIIMVDNDDAPYDYDSNIIYFSLRPRYTNGLFDPIVAYYKDDGDDSPKRYNTTYQGKVFHATEEDLQGQAYAVLDKDKGVMTFFRDEPGKYTNKQEDGNKKYFTGFEEHQNKNCFSAWSGGWRYDYDLRSYIKKIVFKDAIKPNNITGWFEYLSELEELDIAKLDTSSLTGIDYFLNECPKVKNVDISTFDASNVNSVFKSFYKTSIEYLDLSVWNLNQNLSSVQMSEFVLSNNNLKYLNISNFGNWSSSAEFTNLPCLEKIVINDIYDFYRGNLDGQGPNLWYRPSEKQLYTTQQIKSNLHNHSKEMAGYYIRPTCTNSASFTAKYNPSKIKHSINVVDVKETEDLSVEVIDIGNVEYKEPVRFRVKPIVGYIIEEIIITDSNDNIIEYKKLDEDNEYEFIMPDTDVTIKPVYKKIDTPSRKIINPKTGRTIINILLLLMIVGSGTVYLKRKKLAKS